MLDPIIICPTCSSEIKLTESLAAPMLEVAKQEFKNKLADKDIETEKRINQERNIITTQAQERAKADVITLLESKDKTVRELTQRSKELNDKLTAAQETEVKLMRKERELDDARREMQLTIEKQVSESLSIVRSQAKQEVEESLNLKVLEKDQIISSMSNKIDELKKKAEQGSQQLQGEVLEIELEALLREKFLGDIIEPVPKGVHGGDIIHKVLDRTGNFCGSIIWETKRTKNWKDDWLPKLRGDQRDANADIAIIISQVLPKEVKTFDLIEGIWVAEPKYAGPLALVLRRTLMDLAASRSIKEGQQTKMEIVYTYLTGNRFRQRVQAIVEKLSDMREDLDKERKSMTKHWAKREEQTQEIAESMAGMYGDLQGIAGKSLQEVEGLTLLGG